MESFLRQSVCSMLTFFFGRLVFSTCHYVCICFLVFFTLIMSVNMKRCWGIPLYCEQCVFKYTEVGLMEALKPFIGLFHNGSIASFALVQGLDPWSFVCNWIPMQVLSSDHLVPHCCQVEGQPGRKRQMSGECSDLWLCLHSLEIESTGTMAKWQICTQLLHFHTHGDKLNWAIQGCLYTCL